MPNKALLRAMIICLCLAGQGCSHQAWYTGFQQQQRQECYKNANQGDIQTCLDRAGMPYDAYKRQREEALERSR